MCALWRSGLTPRARKRGLPGSIPRYGHNFGIFFLIFLRLVTHYYYYDDDDGDERVPL